MRTFFENDTNFLANIHSSSQLQPLILYLPATENSCHDGIRLKSSGRACREANGRYHSGTDFQDPDDASAHGGRLEGWRYPGAELVPFARSGHERVAQWYANGVNWLSTQDSHWVWIPDCEYRHEIICAPRANR